MFFENPVPNACDCVGDLPGVDVVAPAIILLSKGHYRSLLECHIMFYLLDGGGFRGATIPDGAAHLGFFRLQCSGDRILSRECL
jgi:hypothetical protein